MLLLALCCWFSSLTPDWRFWAMSVCSALRNRRVVGGCCKVWRAVPQPLVHIRSASAAEPGTRRCDEEQPWEAAVHLPFSRAQIGSFFQDRPVLKNPFLEDALLRGYLRRHLPQEVRREPSAEMCYLEMTQDKTLFGLPVLPKKWCKLYAISCFLGQKAGGHLN